MSVEDLQSAHQETDQADCVDPMGHSQDPTVPIDEMLIAGTEQHPSPLQTVAHFRAATARVDPHQANLRRLIACGPRDTLWPGVAARKSRRGNDRCC